jgi:cobalamin biosynthesis protein CobT
MIDDFLEANVSQLGLETKRDKKTKAAVSERMYLALPPDDKLPDGYTMYAAKGLMDHEIAHARYTDPDTIRDNQHRTEVANSLVNIFEDARIEAKVRFDLPGTIDTLGEMNRIGTARVVRVMTEGDDREKFTDMDRLLTALALRHTSPDKEAPYKVLETPQQMACYDSITPYLDAAVQADDSRQAVGYARGVAKALGVQWLKDPTDEPPDEPDPRTPSGGGDGDGEGEGDGDQEGEGDVAALSSWTPGGTGVNWNSPHAVVNEDLKEIMGEASKRAKLELARHTIEAEAASLDGPIYAIPTGRGSDDVVEDLAHQMRAAGKMAEAKRKYNIRKDKLLPTICGLRSMFMRHLLAQRRDVILRCRERGSLDTNRLAHLATRTSDKVFKQIIPGVKLTCRVTLLVDCSGSMAGGSDRTARSAACALAEALYGLPGIEFEILGFTTLPKSADPSSWKPLTPWKRRGEDDFLGGAITSLIETGSSVADPNCGDESKAGKGQESIAESIFKGASTEARVAATARDYQRTERLYHLVVAPFGNRDRTKLNAIEGLYGRYNNVDGESLRWAARRNLAKKADRRILFVISDGSPAANFIDGREGKGTTRGSYSPGWFRKGLTGAYSSPNYVDLKSAVKAARRAGIEVIGLGITGAVDTIKEFYGEHGGIQVRDEASLPKVLLDEIRRVIMDPPNYKED